MRQRQIEKEVNRQAVLFEQECMKGNVTAAVKFEDFAGRWFSEFAERSLKVHTLHNYRRVAPSVFAEIGHIRIDKITKRHIQAYAIKLADTQKNAAKEHIRQVRYTNT